MDPVAAQLLNAMGDICLRDDSASSNIREYSSNDEKFHDEHDTFFEEKSEEDVNIHWLKALKVNDKLDAFMGRWSKSWNVGTILQIIPDSTDSNIITYFIAPNSKWTGKQYYKIDFDSPETIKNLMPLYTHTPYHLPVLNEECNYNGQHYGYGKPNNCHYCNRFSCQYCLLIPDKNSPDNQYGDKSQKICYFCVCQQYKTQIIKILSSKIFNSKIDKMDTNLLNVICIFVRKWDCNNLLQLMVQKHN